MYKKERKSWMKHLDFTILDIICLELAYALSYFMRFGRKNEFLNEEYQRLAVVLILIDICVVFFGESYKSILRRKNTQEFKHVVVHATIIVAGMMVYGYWTRQSDFSRQIFLMFWGLSMIFEFVGRSGLKNFIKKKMIYWLFLVASVVVASFSQILLKKSAAKKYDNVIKEYLNPYVIIGYAMMVGTTVLTILAYHGIEYKNGPVIESLGYILIMILSFFFFKEPITKRKVFGNALILLGIIVFYL